MGKGADALIQDAIEREAETIDDLRKRTRAIRVELATFDRPRPPSVSALSEWYGMSGFMLGATAMILLGGLLAVMTAR